MPSRNTATDKPGSEVEADKRRNDPYPKMEGDQWHDQAERENLEPEVMAGKGAILGEQIEGSPDNSVEKMNAHPKRKRMTPISKQHEATKPVQGSRKGAKGGSGSGNPG